MKEGSRVVAIFDIGKTNKKMLLFDENYRVAGEWSEQFQQQKDEDGDPCENLETLNEWLRTTLANALRSQEFQVGAVNFASYGASFVHVDKSGKVLAPLYDYLKPYPPGLAERLYDKYGGKESFCRTTASPALGNLNSGLQLYRLKETNPALFTQVHYSLHLPQYLASLISGRAVSDITSIGCHTMLWDFDQQEYHRWTLDERVRHVLAPIVPSDTTSTVNFHEKRLVTGLGLHDSSSALIPYLSSFQEPFVLLSTGTWNISLNPFNHTPLTDEELRQDCLCYLDYRGHPVKSSRLFAGHVHEVQTMELAEHFHVAADYFKTVAFDDSIVLRHRENPVSLSQHERGWHRFSSYEIAYHQLINDLVKQQEKSTRLVLEKGDEPRRIFVDGGFGSNEVFMNMLAGAFRGSEVYAAIVPQATALGAALAIHSHWNQHELPRELVQLKRYPATQEQN